MDCRRSIIGIRHDENSFYEFFLAFTFFCFLCCFGYSVNLSIWIRSANFVGVWDIDRIRRPCDSFKGLWMRAISRATQRTLVAFAVVT
jgi:hypothetical protein